MDLYTIHILYAHSTIQTVLDKCPLFSHNNHYSKQTTHKKKEEEEKKRKKDVRRERVRGRQREIRRLLHQGRAAAAAGAVSTYPILTPPIQYYAIYDGADPLVLACRKVAVVACMDARLGMYTYFSFSYLLVSTIMCFFSGYYCAF